MANESLANRSQAFVSALQNTICETLETFEDTARFKSDQWERPDPSGKGGGGTSRILRDGKVFEQAGVNVSAVQGTLPIAMAKKLLDSDSEVQFFATGVSLVIHPRSPLVPTTHANFRYFETAGKRWFGGGIDLTPYVLFPEDAQHFHTTLKKACDKHDPTFYARFKQWCDEYFYLPHRGETRGIGGVFFDYLGRDDNADFESLFQFVQSIGTAFLPSYAPIVERRKDAPYTDAQRQFQLLRRGRYVEFNLLYDRGTQFGLQTKGRTESILMSLPPLVRWEYDYQIAPNSPEEQLITVLRKPRDWICVQ